MNNPKTFADAKVSTKKFKKRASYDASSFDREVVSIKEAITGLPVEHFGLDGLSDSQSSLKGLGHSSSSSGGGSKPRRKISRKKPGQKTSLNYFDDKTQSAIVAYQEALEVEKKKSIFVADILPAFDSLVENLINVYGFNVMHESKQDLKNECLEFLYTVVGKFNPGKGSKAFSYFNVVAKNWLTIRSRQSTKKVQTYVSIDNRDELAKEDLEAIENYQVMPSWDDVLSTGNAHDQLLKVVAAIEGRVKTENEILCLGAINELIKNIEEVDLLSKRAVLLYIREMTNLSSKQLSIVLSSLKKHYREVKNQDDQV